MAITASFRMGEQDQAGVEVLNPGGWFGKAWLVEVGGSYAPFFVAVEADTVADAIDEFSDSKHGHQIHVDAADLADYPEEDRQYDGSGRVIDTGHLMIHGAERADLPYRMTYHGEGLDPAGLDPREYDPE
jgi:hypothetical protein